jgi:hypothetical protein
MNEDKPLVIEVQAHVGQPGVRRLAAGLQPHAPPPANLGAHGVSGNGHGGQARDSAVAAYV